MHRILSEQSNVAVSAFEMSLIFQMKQVNSFTTDQQSSVCLFQKANAVKQLMSR